nr:hypothetical protein [Tanacetum cinerariifolium]
SGNRLFSFTLSRNSPGASGTAPKVLWLVLYDKVDRKIFAVSQRIDLFFATTTVAAQPSISSLSPTTGYTGTKVIITGSGFSRTSYVFIGNQVMSFEIVDDTHLAVIIPPNASTGLIKVQVANFPDSNGVTFTIPPPTGPPEIKSAYVDYIDPNPTPDSYGGNTRGVVVGAPGEMLRIYSKDFDTRTGGYDIYVKIPTNAGTGPIYLITASL